MEVQKTFVIMFSELLTGKQIDTILYSFKIIISMFPYRADLQFVQTFSDKNGFIDFKEFLLAIDVTSSGTPEQKLNWAFK